MPHKSAYSQITQHYTPFQVHGCELAPLHQPKLNNSTPCREDARPDCSVRLEMNNHRWGQDDKESVKLFTHAVPLQNKEKDTLSTALLSF